MVDDLKKNIDSWRENGGTGIWFLKNKVETTIDEVETSGLLVPMFQYYDPKCSYEAEKWASGGIMSLFRRGRDGSYEEYVIPEGWTNTEEALDAFNGEISTYDVTSYEVESFFERCVEFSKKYMKNESKNAELRESMQGIFNGLCYCGECGSIMRFARRGHAEGDISFRAYDCLAIKNGKRCGNKYIHEDYLRIIVSDQIRLMIKNIVDRKTLLEDIIGDNSQEGRLQSLKVKITNQIYQISELEDKKTRLYEDFAEGILTKDDYQLMREHYIREIQKKTESLKANEELLKKITDTAAKYLEVIENFNSHISDEVFEENFIREVVGKIVVNRDGSIELTFKVKDMYQEILDLIEEAEINGE